MIIADNIKNLIPYKPGKPISETKREFGLTDVIKLASNENPLGPSPEVLKAVAEAAQELHRYPDASCFDLNQAVLKYFKKQDINLTHDQLVFGNGSNELIDLVIRCFCGKDDKILIPESSFIAYAICAQAAGIGVTQVPLAAGLKVDLNSIYETWKASPEAYKIIFLPNPNNPTGQVIGKDEVDLFLSKMGDQKSTMIVFDEAYFEFVRDKAYANSLEYLSNSDHIMVLRTFSKVFGLAGLRVGVLAGQSKWVDYLHRIRNPFNVNSLAQAAVIAALEDEDYLKKSQITNWSGLDYFYKSFEQLNIKYWPSEANFVLFDVGQDSEVVFKNLLQKGVILRPVKGYGLKTQLRLSVGLAFENEKAISEIKNVLKG